MLKVEFMSAMLAFGRISIQEFQFKELGVVTGLGSPVLEGETVGSRLTQHYAFVRS